MHFGVLVADDGDEQIHHHNINAESEEDVEDDGGPVTGFVDELWVFTEYYL